MCVDEDHTQIVQSIRDLIDDRDISGTGLPTALDRINAFREHAETKKQASSILKLISLYAVKYGAQNEQTLRSLSAAACQSKSINRQEFDQKIRAVRDYAMTQSYQVS